MEEGERETTKWQPVMLVTDQRVECGKCGALAIFVTLEAPRKYPDMASRVDASDIEWGYAAYCQDCWRRETEEEADA